MREEVEIDARGLLCPIPVLRLAKALRDSPSGTVALLLATDPAALEDVETFCREQNHTLLTATNDAGVFRFRIRKP